MANLQYDILESKFALKCKSISNATLNKCINSIFWHIVKKYFSNAMLKVVSNLQYVILKCKFALSIAYYKFAIAIINYFNYKNVIK